MDAGRLQRTLENLTGEVLPHPERLQPLSVFATDEEHQLGYSQLNELLLLGGLDRMTHAFFAYLLAGVPDYSGEMAFESVAELEAGVDRFRKMALLNYGNVKFAFKALSRDADLLRADLEAMVPLDPGDFGKRHEPIFPVRPINASEAYLTGYLVEAELARRLEAAPEDSVALELENRRREVVDVALLNQSAYYASDHLDVYVATSMRERHEFLAVSRIVRKIFEDPAVAPLKLRWFDPTQAYCKNRIDKGLAEALMLKRASCTIYLAQETDTLGKDSELASTLAQGKPVIAYVPEVDSDYLEDHYQTLQEAAPERSFSALLLEQLRLFEPDAAWRDPEVQDWCRSPDAAPVEPLKARVTAKIKLHYDGRARTLMDRHPLGIQVNLGTGVANGVLVVRRLSDCASIVARIMTRTLDVVLEDSNEMTTLRESISGSIFRVMTRDPMLTNTFWNFYLKPAE